MADNGFGVDFKEFDELINQVEKLGGSVDEIAEICLDAATPVALKAYAQNVPRGEEENPQGHAQDKVYARKTRKSKLGNHYRVITFRGKRGYLFVREYGSSHQNAKPWRDKANKAAQKAAQPILLKTLSEEIEKLL